MAAEGGEDPRYLREQLVTCIGNKRRLLDFVGQGLAAVQARLGRRRLDIADLFAGSGVVSRFFKGSARRLFSSDLEDWSAACGRCFLTNRSAVDAAELADAVEALRSLPPNPGFVAELYAPADDDAIADGERAFYSRANAVALDTLRRGLGELPTRIQDLLLGPLLSEASIHANTAGVFKGFYKDRRSGRGRFGGSGEDALGRILAPIVRRPPVLSRADCPVEVRQGDALAVARALPELDLAYLDPPYTQHPYRSNYFMLNLLTGYERPDPAAISRVSGIPPDWRRSAWNRRRDAQAALAELVDAVPAAFVLVSYNDEGFLSGEQIEATLARSGSVTVLERPYEAFRGSRNLRARPLQVRERLFLLERRAT